MTKWLTTKQLEYIQQLIKLDLRSPLIIQALIDTHMTTNQLQEFNRLIKPYGKKLIRKKHNYTIKNIMIK